MKTVNKDDLIKDENGDSITVGDYFTNCYDTAIARGSSHADAHNLADNMLAMEIPKHNCDMESHRLTSLVEK